MHYKNDMQLTHKTPLWSHLYATLEKLKETGTANTDERWRLGLGRHLLGVRCLTIMSLVEWVCGSVCFSKFREHEHLENVYLKFYMDKLYSAKPDNKLLHTGIKL